MVDILTKNGNNIQFLSLKESIRENLFFYIQQLIKDLLEVAPENVKKLVKSIRADLTEFIDLINEAIDLANDYIREKFVRQTKLY